MAVARTAISFALLALALACVCLNWYWWLANRGLKRKGIERHVSTVPFVAQAPVVLSALMSSAEAPWHTPAALYWVVALTDVSLWQLPRLLLKRA